MDVKVRTGIAAGVGVGVLLGITVAVAIWASSTNKPAAPEPQPKPQPTARPVVADTPRTPPVTKRDLQDEVPERPRPPKSYRTRPNLPDPSEMPVDDGSSVPTPGFSRPPTATTPRRAAPPADDLAVTESGEEKREVANKPFKLNATDQGYLNRFNAFRSLAGVRPVSIDPELSVGCVAHARYLVAHHGSPATAGLGVHAESPSQAGFSKAGDLAARRSVITEFGSNLPGLPDRGWPFTAIDLWMSTLYHRVPMLDPDLTRIGLGYARNDTATAWYVDMDVGGGRDSEGGTSSKAVIYPGNGQTDVPRRFGWGTPELPNPLPAGYKPDNAGYPITVSFPRAGKIADVTATLRHEADEAEPSAKPEDVSFWLSTPERPACDADQQSTICLIAAKRFREHGTYRVSVEATVDGKKWQKTWKFTTGRMK
jgi:uncharacterized protein YkwD